MKKHSIVSSGADFMNNNEELLKYIIKEDDGIVVFTKEFTQNKELEHELNEFVLAIKDTILISESLVLRIDDTEIDLNLKKQERFNVQNVLQRIKLLELENIIVRITVYKETENILHFFSINQFVENINNKSLEDQLKYFQKNYTKNICFIISRITKVFMQTYSFCIIDYETYNSNRDSYSFLQDNNRNEILNSFNQNCNYLSELKLELTPFDFIISKVEVCNQNLCKIFERLNNLVSMIFLANISEFTHEKYEFRIYGYHNTNIIMDKSTNIEKEVLSNLFKWTYSNTSNISDKLGILRNVISLFLINNKFNDITDGILSSCKSNYSIYLKENAERYIEVKNNQQIILNSIIDDIVSTCNVYKTSFKQSLLNIMTFFFSVVVLNVISTGGIDKIFALEISILYIFLLVGFCILAKLGKKDAMDGLDMLERKYKRNKNSYLDIIDEHDLNRILENDSYFLKEKREAENRINQISNCWIKYQILLIAIIIICFNNFIIFRGIFYLLHILKIK